MKNGLIAMVGVATLAAVGGKEASDATRRWGMIIDLNRCCAASPA